MTRPEIEALNQNQAAPKEESMPHSSHYLRVSVARWTIDTRSPEAEQIFRRIETEGVAVFREQPGFISYRLMREDAETTVAVAEWESQALGLAGAERYRAWMRAAGIAAHFALETHAGAIVATSK
jgi:heme-degrading monooxygenase HmoA